MSVPNSKRPVNISDKLNERADLLTSNKIDGLYHTSFPMELIFDLWLYITYLGDRISRIKRLNQIYRMMALDCMMYLPGNVLIKIDRSGMGVSLEVCVTFLEHRVVEFAGTYLRH